ncbi:helix-turn-helix domain-containing protein [Actinoalloteichus fjordicus]|uniref:Transcriptional regulator n=1 Tax=Actinoalloteichus fjordicus TaxID=1612552 RepID=A0AAC9PSP8_9PSEU|nr:helix-turn-helix transcriptional regulator [Actinoalloteichus fjordicus]APU15245.1 putative transcriptional regulator [Actinoalloteichus fjordicus]
MELPIELTVGERIARARIARGISQEALAGLVGRSAGWVSKVERGVLPLDRKSVLLKLAAVLEVDVDVLDGRSPVANVSGDISRAVVVGEVRQALMRWAMPVINQASAGPCHPLSALRQRVDTANRLRQDAKFGRLALVLPALLDDLRDAISRTESSVDRAIAQTLAAEAMHDARAMTKKLGHLDLAWMSAELAGQAARQSSDPLMIAANAWNHIEVYKTANAPGPARALALATIDRLAEGLSTATPGHLSLWGTLHLQAALIAAYWSNRDDAATHLDEAAAAARRLGGDGNHYDTMFGTTNVGIHRVAVAVELGEPEAAIAHAKKIDASGLGRERRARLEIDLARAFSQARRHEKTLGSLLAAEKLAPDYVRPHPLVREIVGSHLRRAKPALRSLAQRIGVT